MFLQSNAKSIRKPAQRGGLTISTVSEVATTRLLPGGGREMPAREKEDWMHSATELQRCRQSGAVGAVRTIGSGSAATQMQRQPPHSYVGTRIWPSSVGWTGWPFSCRHLGQMASSGGSGGTGLRLDLVCVGGNRTFVLREFPGGGPRSSRPLLGKATGNRQASNCGGYVVATRLRVWTVGGVDSWSIIPTM